MQENGLDKKDGKIYVVGNKPVKELLLDTPSRVDFVALKRDAVTTRPRRSSSFAARRTFLSRP